jgi:hypothetical protein
MHVVEVLTTPLLAAPRIALVKCVLLEATVLPLLPRQSCALRVRTGENPVFPLQLAQALARCVQQAHPQLLAQPRGTTG